MRRRQFITLLGGAAVAWPLAARAQQGERVRRIGVLLSTREGDPQRRAQLAALVHRLTELGWADGRNARLDVRWTAGSADAARKYAAELVALAPDVIITDTSFDVAAVQQATRTVPIVFGGVIDPVGAGLVNSLARPGGNTQGSPPSNTPSARNGSNCSRRSRRTSRARRFCGMPPLPPALVSSPPYRRRRRSGSSCARSVCMMPAPSSPRSRPLPAGRTAD